MTYGAETTARPFVSHVRIFEATTEITSPQDNSWIVLHKIEQHQFVSHVAAWDDSIKQYVPSLEMP